MKREFLKGLRDGIPIFLGYLSVSFGFGILAIQLGLGVFPAVLISATNLTSAGQVAGVGIIAAGGTIIEMILTQFLINCRYSLMAVSLTQKLSPTFTRPHRFIASFGITDEIFGVAFSRIAPVTPAYMYGLVLISFVGWTSGTLLGAVSGEFLPERIIAALGILLYGMFIAIIIPPIRKSAATGWTILIAAVISIGFYYLLPELPGGFQIIISATVAAGVMAFLKPLPPEPEEVSSETKEAET